MFISVYVFVVSQLIRSNQTESENPKAGVVVCLAPLSLLCKFGKKVCYCLFLNAESVVCDAGAQWCLNGGTCIDVSANVTGDDYYVCQCPPGWQGVHCESDVDECASDPCQNNGTCTHGVNSYNCLCEIGYHGDNCEFGKLFC